MPFLRAVMEGPEAWAASDTISRATEIEGGRVRNEAILQFQGRSDVYPYPPLV